MLLTALKPSTIQVCERGREHDMVKLLDYGLVHVAGGREVPGAVSAAASGNAGAVASSQGLGRTRDLDREPDPYGRTVGAAS